MRFDRFISPLRISDVRGVQVSDTGASPIGPRTLLNFIEGTNVTITIVDNSAAGRADITIAASGGGGNHNLLSATHPDTVIGTPVLGDTLYANVTPAWIKLAGNTTTTKNFLTQTGTGVVSAAPVWGVIVDADVPDILTITKISNLVTNGFVKTSAGDGTLVIDTSTYLTTVTPHNLLSATHSDTIVASATAGDMIYANSGIPPKWTVLGIGAGGQAILSNGTLPVWGYYLAENVAKGSFTAGSVIFMGAATLSEDVGIFTYDVITSKLTVPVVDVVRISNLITNGFIKTTGGNGTLSIDTNTYLTTVTPHNILSATHGDSTAASVTRGGLIVGVGVSPKWTLLVTGTANKFLHTDGTDLAWSQVNIASADVTGVLPLANGGTNANLTASNGGIFYSTATAGAILAASTIAGRALISGASSAPSWWNPSVGGVVYITTNGALANDATNFFWDATNDRLGIGTSGPSGVLHLQTATVDANLYVTAAGGSNAANIQIQSGIAAWGGIQWNTASTNRWYVGNRGGFTGQLGFYAGAGWSQEAVFLADGKFGLKQGTPTARLHIGTDGQVGHIRMDGIAGDPVSPTEGDIWRNSTQKSMRFCEAAGLQGFVGLIYKNTADSNTVSNTTTETDFNTNFTFPASSLTVGKVIRLKAAIAWQQVSGTVQFKVYLGANAVFSHTALTLTSASASDTVIIETVMIIRSTGAPGTVAPHTLIVFGAGRAYDAAGNQIGANNNVNVTTTSTAICKVAVQFNTASASNNATLRNITLEVLD